MRRSAVAFVVQAHEANRQLDWLLAWLSQSGSSVILSFDGVPPEARDGLQVLRSEPVCWGGYSQVSAFLSTVEHALGRGEWDYIVNLSGTCFPTKPFAALADYLDHLGAERSSLVGAKPTGSRPLRHKASFRQPHYVASSMLTSRNVGILCEPEILSRFEKIENSPVFDIHARLDFHVEEIPSMKTLLVRALTTAEATARSALLDTVRLHFGRAWYCLHRSTAETIVKTSVTSRSIDLLRNAFEPDELFLQTLLHGEVEGGRVVNGNLHANWGDPNVVDAARWRQANGGESFFVRKVNPWHFDEVLGVARGKI